MSTVSVPGFAVIWRAPLARVALALFALALGIYLPSPLRAAVVLPIALTLPGYALLSGLRSRLMRDDPVATLAGSAIVSISLLSLAALAMYAGGVRVSAENVSHLIVAFVVAMIAISPSLRALSPGPADPFALERTASLQGFALPVAAIAVAIGVVALALGLLPGAPTTRFVDAAFAGPQLRSSSSTLVAPETTRRVLVTVRNRSGSVQTYAIAPSMARGRWYGTTVRLQNGESWSGAVIGRVPAGGCLHRLRIAVRSLARTDADVSLTTWFRSTPELPAECRVVPS